MWDATSSPITLNFWFPVVPKVSHGATQTAEEPKKGSSQLGWAWGLGMFILR